MGFEDEVRAAVDRALGGLRDHLETELRGVADGIAAAALTEQATAAARATELAAAAAAEVRREMDAQLRDLESQREEVVARLQAAEAQARDVQARLEQTDLQRQHAESQRGDAESQRDEAQARCAAAESQRDEAQAQRADAEAEREQTEALRRDAELQLRQLEQQHRQVEAQIAQVRASAQQQLEDIRGSLEGQIAELKRSLADVRRGAQAEADRAVEDAVERTRSDAHHEQLAQGSRLVDAIRTLDEAQSLGELLDSLVDCAGKEAARAAVLVVKSSRLTGWRLIGFGSRATEPSSIQLDADTAGIAGTVLRTGVSVSWPPTAAASPHGAEAALPAFARDQDSSFALALPILVGGSVVAVLYADAPAGNVPPAASRSSVALEILARHASRALEAMTMRQVVGVSVPPGQPIRAPRLNG